MKRFAAGAAALLFLSPFAVVRAEPRTGAANKLQALVFGGGTDAAVAASWLERWTHLAPAFQGVLTTADAWPNAVRSADVPGMKPGFHVVVLGYCRAEDAKPVLAVLKALAPWTYVREVHVPESESASCPRLAPGAALRDSQTIARDGLQLRTAYTTSEAGHQVRLALFDAEDRPLQTEGLDEEAETTFGEPAQCDLSLKPDGRRIHVQVECTIDAIAGANHVSWFAYRRSFAIHKGKIEAATLDLGSKSTGYLD